MPREPGGQAGVTHYLGRSGLASSMRSRRSDASDVAGRADTAGVQVPPPRRVAGAALAVILGVTTWAGCGGEEGDEFAREACRNLRAIGSIEPSNGRKAVREFSNLSKQAGEAAAKSDNVEVRAAGHAFEVSIERGTHSVDAVDRFADVCDAIDSSADREKAAVVLILLFSPLIVGVCLSFDVLARPRGLWKRAGAMPEAAWVAIFLGSPFIAWIVAIFLPFPFLSWIAMGMAWWVYATGDRRRVREHRDLESRRIAPPAPEPHATAEDAPCRVEFRPGRLVLLRCARCDGPIDAPQVVHCPSCGVELAWDHSEDALAKWERHRL